MRISGTSLASMIRGRLVRNDFVMSCNGNTVVYILLCCVMIVSYIWRVKGCIGLIRLILFMEDRVEQIIGTSVAVSTYYTQLIASIGNTSYSTSPLPFYLPPV